MNDLERDSLRARLRAGDPYQGEPMPTPDAARIKARMRSAAAVGPRIRPRWIPAAATMVAVVALGIWAASRPSTTQAPLPLAAPATSGGDVVAESPSDAFSIPELPSVPEPARDGLAVAQQAPAIPAPAESGLVAVAPPETAEAAPGAVATTTVAAADPPPAAARRIHFTAPRGTRIVWTLDPDFDPSMTRNGAPTARHQQGANGKW